MRKNQLRQLDEGSTLCVPDQFEQCGKLATRYVIQQRNWYRSRAKWIRRYFRLSGFGMILLGAALPVVAIIDFEDSKVVITVLSVSIAALTALRTFFQWDLQWRILKIADWKLTGLLAEWEVEICAMNRNGEIKDDLAQAMARTQRLIRDTKKVVEEESHAFFAEVRWPQGTGSESMR